MKHRRKSLINNVRRKEYKYRPSRKQRERERKINNMMYFAQENDKRKKRKLLNKYKDDIDIVFKENIWVHLLLFSVTAGIGNIIYHLKIKEKNRLMSELRNDMKR